SGDSHTGKGSTICTSLRHDTCLTELQGPQVAAEEHGVKRCGAAWLQKLHHAILIDGKGFIGVLSATGHLRPVATVCGSRNDAWIHSRWGHAAQDDWGHTGPLRETGLSVGLAVRQGDEFC